MSIMDQALRAADAECEALKAELWKKDVHIRKIDTELTDLRMKLGMRDLRTEALEAALRKIATQECILAPLRQGGNCGMCLSCIARTALETFEKHE